MTEMATGVVYRSLGYSRARSALLAFWDLPLIGGYVR